MLSFFPLPLHRSELRNQTRDKDMFMYKFIDFFLIRCPTHGRISSVFDVILIKCAQSEL